MNKRKAIKMKKVRANDPVVVADSGGVCRSVGRGADHRIGIGEQGLT